MTERQNRFVDEFLKTGNASESARRAGYSAKSAKVTGAKLLANANLSAAVDERLKEMASERIAETQEVLEHLTAVMRGEVVEEVVTPGGKKIPVHVRESDRLKAADMILKVRGEYREKVEVKADASQLLVSTLEKIWTPQAGAQNEETAAAD